MPLFLLQFSTLAFQDVELSGFQLLVSILLFSLQSLLSAFS
jgi:hypothetical protein